MKKAIVGIVDSYKQAETLVSGLQAAGVPAQDISVLFPDKGGTKDFAYEHSTKAPEGAVAGASVGGIAGGAIGLLAGIGALAIPGLGPFIAAGPIMATLSGVAAGATLGGVAGALVGMGIPEMEAKAYEGKLRGGNILIAVHTESADVRKQVEDVLKRGGVHDVSATNEAAVPRAARLLEKVSGSGGGGFERDRRRAVLCRSSYAQSTSHSDTELRPTLSPAPADRARCDSLPDRSPKRNSRTPIPPSSRSSLPPTGAASRMRRGRAPAN